MNDDFKISDEKHAARKEQWKGAFRIPETKRVDVFGYDEEMKLIVEHLRGLIAAKKAPVPFPRVRGAQNGVFLTGEPGTGKTLIISAAAGILQVPLLVAQPAHLLGDWAGPTGHNMAALFGAGMDIASAGRGAILLLDEIEALNKRRADGNGWDVTLSNLLKFIDRACSVEDGSRLVVVGATNSAESVEPALISRFGLHIQIGLPRASARRTYLEDAFAAARGAGFLREDVDLEALVRESEGMTFREIAQALDLVNGVVLSAGMGKPEPARLLVTGEAIKAAIQRFRPVRREPPVSLVPRDIAFG